MKSTAVPSIKPQQRDSYSGTRRARSFFVAPACLAILSASLCWVGADTYPQLNITVNQLDSAKLPNLRDRQDAMNKICKQCDKFGVHFRVTLSKTNLNQNPTNSNGNLIAPQGKVADDAAVDSLTQNALNGEVKDGGYKIWFAASDKDGNANGTTKSGKPCSVLAAGSSARTWMHEIAHGLGLDHSSDDENFLYGKDREGNHTSGSSVTEDQCKAMLAGIKKLHPSADKNPTQKRVEPPAKSAAHHVVSPPPSPPLKNSTADVPSTRFVFDSNLINPSNNSLYITLQVNAPFTNVPTASYSVWLDTDNNPTTGSNGFDAVLKMGLTTTNSGQVVLQTFNPPLTTPIGSLTAVTTEIFDDGYTNSTVTVSGTEMDFSVPLSMLAPLAPMIRVMVRSQDGPLSDTLGPELAPTIPPVEPSLVLSPDEGPPGSVVQVVGGGFASNVNYIFLFDDVPVAQGGTSPGGTFSTTFTVPALVPGDYLLDALDELGNVQVFVFRIDGPAISIAPGIDLFTTPPGGSSYQDFSPPIPAGFFGPGSDPFSGHVILQGAPIQTLPPGIMGTTDTIIQRLGAAMVPGTNDTVPIEIVGLSLVSVTPITVTYNGGQNPESWGLHIYLSGVVTQSTGSMTITAGPCVNQGGTFDATLPVMPRLVFTRVSPPATNVLDYGSAGFPSLQFTIANGHWLPFDPGFGITTSSGNVFVDHDGNPSTPPFGPLPPTSNFFSGVRAAHCKLLCEDAPEYLARVTSAQASQSQHTLLPARAPGSDTDADGIPDYADNCPMSYNPLQEDSNDDGVGDACDLAPTIAVAQTGNNVTLQWPRLPRCFQVQSANAVSATTSWVSLTNASVVVGNSNQLTLGITNQEQFYRLQQLAWPY